MKIIDLSRIGFDTFQRYKRIVDIITVIRNIEKKEHFSILDVGGYPCEFEKFSDDTIFVTDIPYCKKENYIKGSGINLPIKDNSLDIVISSDTYEHIPINKREQFLNEIIRVSKKYVILGAPFKSEINEFIEDELCRLHDTIFHKEHPWLYEHKLNSLPLLNLTTEYLCNNNYPYHIFPNGNAFIWYLFQWCYYLFQSLPDLSEYSYKINNLYNNYLYSKDNSEPSYRTIILISKDKTDSDIKIIANEIIANSSQKSDSSNIEPFIIMTAILSDVIEKINFLKKTDSSTESHQTLLQYIERLESVIEDNSNRCGLKQQKQSNILKKIFGNK